MYEKKIGKFFLTSTPDPRLEKICEQNVNNAILEKILCTLYLWLIDERIAGLNK